MFYSAQACRIAIVICNNYGWIQTLEIQNYHGVTVKSENIKNASRQNCIAYN